MSHHKKMEAFLLTYNPKIWQWGNISYEIELLKKNGFVDTNWDCSSKKPKEGDLFFINALGTSKQKGIFCSGYVKELYENVPSNINENRITNNLKGDIIVLLNPNKEKILDISILQKKLPNVRWYTQNSGIKIKKEYIDELLKLWDTFLQENNIINYEHIEKEYLEGNLQQKLISKYERSIEARNICINHYGYICQVCKLNMEERYGDVGKNFIHVHHKEFLSDIKEKHKIDPINDLVTVCPNCHSMLHRKVDGKYLKIQELLSRIKQP
jgi:5-methylcytosine-specific restriction protein A